MGCGYKPATTYTKKVLSDDIYAEVKVYLRDPQNAVVVKDALNRAIVDRFGARVRNRKDASTQLYVTFKQVRFTPIQYDNYGYAIYYRAKVVLDIRYRTPDAEGEEWVTGVYNFPIAPNAVISDELRFKAIKEGSLKALDAFVSRIARKGSKL
jgi:hypothetical protein